MSSLGDIMRRACHSESFKVVNFVETALRRVADHWQLSFRLEVELIQADASDNGIRASGIYWAVDLATKRYLNG